MRREVSRGIAAQPVRNLRVSLLPYATFAPASRYNKELFHIPGTSQRWGGCSGECSPIRIELTETEWAGAKECTVVARHAVD